MWQFDTLVALHIVSGTVGLITLWVPIIGKKGSPTHRRWGRIFAHALLITGILAIGISVVTLLYPLETHPFSDDEACRHLCVHRLFRFWCGEFHAGAGIQSGALVNTMHFGYRPIALSSIQNNDATSTLAKHESGQRFQRIARSVKWNTSDDSKHIATTCAS